MQKSVGDFFMRDVVWRRDTYSKWIWRESI